MDKIGLEIVKSWAVKTDSCFKMDAILDWISKKNIDVPISIKQSSLQESNTWFYDKTTGEIRKKNNGFFKIVGIRSFFNHRILEQPIIIQDEIGYLGIICKMINSTMHFLMQAKIEPGNINKIQISPTIQATKSNFTKAHGGQTPPYLDFFINSDKHYTIVDQIQSEQSSRFLKKRNRNIIILVDDNVEVLDSHMWMTLGQIKSIMKFDNLVNMDTRTVLSCIPYSLMNLSYADVKKYFNDQDLARSVFNDYTHDFINVFKKINDFKMYNDFKYEIIRLDELSHWEFKNDEFVSSEKSNFKVIFCDVFISGREVLHWDQPLLCSLGKAFFGLFTCVEKGVRKFLIKLTSEIGNFDKVELGPTIQKESSDMDKLNYIEEFFMSKYDKKQDILNSVVLSEEGGRFYHEQNNNVIINILVDDIASLPVEYFWVDYKTLNTLNQYNNVLNIQLRNLLSLLEV